MYAGAAFKLTDPTTWPVFLYAWLALVAIGLAKPAWQWLQRRRAANWPTTTGRIEVVTVAPVRGERGASHAGEIGYSYSVAGVRGGGWYRRNFPSEDEAYEFVRDLRDKSIAIHYNPAQPSDSWLSEPELEMLLLDRAPLEPLESHLASRPVSKASRLLLLAGVWISAIGLLASIWVHAGAVMGRRVVLEEFFGILHIGIFVVWVPAVFLAKTTVGKVQRRDFWKAVLKNSPAIVWRMFSGHWMAFYSAALAILYSAWQLGDDVGVPR